MLNNTMPSFIGANLKSVKTDELIKHRYAFYMGLLKSYVEYAQMVESKSKPQVEVAVNEMADALIAKYTLGSQFVYDIKSFINARYIKPHYKVIEELQMNCGVPEEVFGALLNDFNEKRHPAVDAAMGNRFRSILG